MENKKSAAEENDVKKNYSSSRGKVGITSAIDKGQSNETNEDNITVSIGSPMVQEKSKIYGRDRKDATLNDWQIAVNQAAYELCQKDIALMYNRQALKTEVERKARETYVFKRKVAADQRKQSKPVRKEKKDKIELRRQERKTQRNKRDIISERISYKNKANFNFKSPFC